jgi:hypothetical protein
MRRVRKRLHEAENFSFKFSTRRFLTCKKPRRNKKNCCFRVPAFRFLSFSRGDFSFLMRAQRAGDQADAARKQDEHADGCEKRGRLKINLHIHNHGGEDYHQTGEGQNPADDGFAVEKQYSDAENQRQQRKPETVVSPEIPKTARDDDAVHKHITARDRHRQSDQKFPDAARRSAYVAKILIFVE